MSAAEPSHAIVTVTRSFAATPESIFDAWLDEATVGEWLFATPLAEMKRAELDPRPGGRFVISEKRGEALAEHFGTYEIIDRPAQLVFTFTTAQHQPPTRVEVGIVPSGTGCTLTLKQSSQAASAGMLERSRQGWSNVLDTLARIKSA